MPLKGIRLFATGPKGPSDRYHPCSRGRGRTRNILIFIDYFKWCNFSI